MVYKTILESKKATSTFNIMWLIPGDLHLIFTPSILYKKNIQMSTENLYGLLMFLFAYARVSLNLDFHPCYMKIKKTFFFPRALTFFSDNYWIVIGFMNILSINKLLTCYTEMLKSFQMSSILSSWLLCFFSKLL